MTRGGGSIMVKNSMMLFMNGPILNYIRMHNLNSIEHSLQKRCIGVYNMLVKKH